MHTQTQIQPLHIGGADMVRVGSAVNHLGYGLHNSWWGISVRTLPGERIHLLLTGSWCNWAIYFATQAARCIEL